MYAQNSCRTRVQLSFTRLFMAASEPVIIQKGSRKTQARTSPRIRLYFPVQHTSLRMQNGPHSHHRYSVGAGHPLQSLPCYSSSLYLTKPMYYSGNPLIFSLSGPRILLRPFFFFGFSPWHNHDEGRKATREGYQHFTRQDARHRKNPSVPIYTWTIGRESHATGGPLGDCLSPTSR